ncbi:unnamed protein product, partial [Allacma fusca]
EREIGNL